MSRFKRLLLLFSIQFFLLQLIIEPYFIPIDSDQSTVLTTESFDNFISSGKVVGLFSGTKDFASSISLKLKTNGYRFGLERNISTDASWKAQSTLAREGGFQPSDYGKFLLITLNVLLI